LLSGDYTIDERALLEVTVHTDEEEVTCHALNEVVVSRGGLSRLVDVMVTADGGEVLSCRGDGVIIATPTGSTAYSLSAGGPVVEPVAQTMIVCPICIHNMRFSSYVLSPEHTLTIELERNGRKPVYLFVDESRAFALRSDDQVLVRRSKYVTKLVRLSEKSFCEIFAQKMLPGGFHE
jgi:NAD+ kinase